MSTSSLAASSNPFAPASDVEASPVALYSTGTLWLAVCLGGMGGVLPLLTWNAWARGRTLPVLGLGVGAWFGLWGLAFATLSAGMWGVVPRLVVKFVVVALLNRMAIDEVLDEWMDADELDEVATTPMQP